MVLYGGCPVLDALMPTPLDRLHQAGIKTVRTAATRQTDAKTKVVVSPDGEVRYVELEDTGPVSLPEQPDLEADLLVVGAWDLAEVLPPPTSHLAMVALILGDVDHDASFLRHLEAIRAAGYLVQWTFGSDTLDPKADVEIRRRTGSKSSHIRTSGAGAVTVTNEMGVKSLPVNPHRVSGSTLGAGDAYAGGFLAGAMLGESVEQAHDRAVCEAIRVLGESGATSKPDHSAILHVAASLNVETELIHRFVLETRDALEQMPGPVIISGGQTGVDQIGLTTAVRYGLPAVAVTPYGRRTEEGPFAAHPAIRVIEVPDSSYRLRTWVNTVLSDVTLLYDEVGSEGSVETRSACEHLGKPMINASGLDTKAVAQALFDGVRAGDWRVVNIAGTRSSGLKTSAIDRIETALECAIRRIGASDNKEPLRENLLMAQREPLRIALPKKPAVIDLITAFWQATYGTRVLTSNRLVEVTREGVELMVVRAADVPGLIASGDADAGFTWQNQIREAGHDMSPFFETGWFANYTGVVIPEVLRMPISHLVSQYPKAAKHMVTDSQLISNHAIVTPIDGAAEAFVHTGLAEGAVDTWATGRTAKEHNLMPRDVLERSSLSLYLAEPVGPTAYSFASSFETWVRNC